MYTQGLCPGGTLSLEKRRLPTLVWRMLEKFNGFVTYLNIPFYLNALFAW